MIDGGNSLFTDTQRRQGTEGKGIHFVGCGVSGGEEGALKGPRSCPAARGLPGKSSLPSIPRSPPSSKASRAAVTWARTAPATTSRWSTTASSTATCSSSARPTPSSKPSSVLGPPNWPKSSPSGTKANWTATSSRSRPNFSQERPRHRQTARRCHPRQSRPERHRQMDAAVGQPSIGRDLHDQRRRGSARHFFAQRRARRGVEDPAAPEAEKFTGESRQTDRGRARRPLRLQDRHLRPGDGTLGAASKDYNWNLNFGDIATIWRGGCIIRAKFLNRIAEAYERDPAPQNLILDPYFTDIITKTQANWRIALPAAVETRRRRPRLQRLPRLLRQLPLGRLAGQPAPGPARLLRRAHLRTDRQARRLPHRVDGIGRRAPKTRPNQKSH